MSKIGRVSATEKKPTSTNEFTFWVDKNIEIKPFDIIKCGNNISNKKSVTYGIIKDIFHITDCEGYLGSYVSSDFGDVDTEPMTKRIGVTYAIAEVINNNKDVYMPLKDGAVVEFADETEIREALSLDKIKNPIPAGFIEGTNNISVPIHLNRDFLVGPEGAHLNISGISGLATKTSYAMFLLQAIQQTVRDTAIIILNVKGDDLLRIDEENIQLDDSKIKEWEKVGLQCKPFENVKYYYPYRNAPYNNYSNTTLEKSMLVEQVNLDKCYNYIYTYDNNKQDLDLLFSNVDDPNFTMESILNFIQESNEFLDLEWDEFKEKLSKYTKAGGSPTKDIPVQSWRKFRRIINKSINNDIFQTSKSTVEEKRHLFLSEEIRKVKSGEVYVIDIAKLDEQLQYLVFGDVLKAVNAVKFGDTDRSYEDIPRRIVIFVDELNKYAGSKAPKNSPILANLLDITERGRSEGIVLFSAEQFKSDIHDRVKGNCSTHVYGRTNAIEVSKSDYKFIPSVFKNMMVRLDKGELIMQHSILSTPLKIKFPYPSYYQREDD